MGLEKDWLTLGSTTITHAALSTFDSYGVPQFSTSTTSYDCLIEDAKRQVYRADGSVELSSHRVFLLSTGATIGLQDRLTFPTSSEQPRLLAVDHVRDQHGQHHVEVLIG